MPTYNHHTSLIHTTDEPYKCKECGKYLSCSWDLFQHVKILTGEKPYEFKECEKAFSNNDDLTVHMDKKPHEC